MTVEQLKKYFYNFFDALKNAFSYDKKIHLIALGIFVFFLFFGVIFVLLNEQPSVLYDSVGYHNYGVNISQKALYSNQASEKVSSPDAYRAPGYPFFVAFIYKLTGPNYKSVYLAQAAIYSLTIVMIFYILASFTTISLSLLCAAIAGFYPSYVGNIGFLMTEINQAFFLVAATFFLLKGFKSNRYILWSISGILIGLMTLTKATSLILFIFLLPALLVFSWDNKKAIVLIVCASLITVAPWTLRNYIVMNRFILVNTQTGMGLWAGSVPPKEVWWGNSTMPASKSVREINNYLKKTKVNNPVDLDNAYFKFFIRNFKRDPKAYFKRAGKRFLDYYQGPSYDWFVYQRDSNISVRPSSRLGWLQDFQKIILFFAIIGTFLAFVMRSKLLFLSLLLIYFDLVYMFTILVNRYNTPLLPLLFVMAAFPFSVIHKIAEDKELVFLKAIVYIILSGALILTIIVGKDLFIYRLS